MGHPAELSPYTPHYRGPQSPYGSPLMVTPLGVPSGWGTQLVVHTRSSVAGGEEPPLKNQEDCSSLRGVQPDKCMALPLHWRGYHSRCDGFYLGGRVELYTHLFVAGFGTHLTSAMCVGRCCVRCLGKHRCVRCLANAGVSGVF